LAEQPGSRYYRKTWVALFLVAVTVLSAALILSRDGRIPAHPQDQSFVSTADLRIGQENGVWFFHYPRLQWAGGITGTLTAGLYKLVLPTSPDSLNHHFKIFSMLLFFLAGYLLAGKHLKTRWGLFIFIGLMASSGFQFIEPSTEVLACAYLALFLYGFSSAWHPAVLSFLLACFGLCKVEFVLPAGAILLYWVLTERSKKGKMLILGSFTLWIALFISPVIYLYGKEAVFGNRDIVVFSGYYASLRGYGTLDGKMAWSSEFPKAKSFLDVIILYPQVYLTFVKLAMIKSLKVFLCALSGITPILIARWAHYKKEVFSNRFESAVLVGFISAMLPATLIAYLHFRYMGKFFIPFFILSVSFWEYCRTKRDSLYEIWRGRIILALLIGTIVWQAFGAKAIADYPHSF